eukprot:gene14706-19764_t
MRTIDAFDDTGAVKATALLCKRYNISTSTVQNWVSVNKKKLKKNSNSGGGRNLDLDQTSRLVLKENLIEQENVVEPISAEAFNRIVLEEKVLSKKRKYLSPTEQDYNITIHNTSINHKTVKSIKKACYFRDRVPQSLTDARLTAMSCIRLIYITAVLVWALARFLPKECKWNADCTTFICSANRTGQLVVVFRDKGCPPRQVTSHLGGGELNLLIKYFLIGNASGHLGDPCFIIAIDDMPVDEFYSEFVVGVANNDRIGQAGWIYFCKTKGGNAAMWKHWFKHVCIPTIQSASDLFALRDPNGDKYRNFLSTDGEACILNEAFDPEILQLFKDACIDYMKLGPSATKIEQPADAADIFKDGKKGVAKTSEKGLKIYNNLLRLNMNAFMGRFALAFPTVVLTAAFKEKINYSLEVITHTLRQSYVTGYKLVEGFRRVGQLVDRAFPLAEGEFTVDYDAMMVQCLNKNITREEFENMKQQLPIAAIRAIQHGRLTSVFLDELNICKTPGATERDNLTWCRQQAFIVTHIDTNIRFEVSKQRKLDDANPVIIEQRRQLAQDLKKVASEDAKALKAATLKAAKDIEIVRLRNRNAEEIARDKLLSDAAKIEKKAAKELKIVMEAEESNNRRARLSLPTLL